MSTSLSFIVNKALGVVSLTFNNFSLDKPHAGKPFELSTEP
jgi:hypothetical protein